MAVHPGSGRSGGLFLALRRRVGHRRRQGLADVQPRRASARGTTPARRRSTDPTPAGSRRSGGSPPGARTRRSGSIHATPIVVNGYVYFGTATDPTFYKLTPDGKVRWSYRRTPASGGGAQVRQDCASSRRPTGSCARPSSPTTRSISPTWAAGSTRSTARPEPSGGRRVRAASDFPGAHPINVFFAGPIVAQRQADRRRRHARAGHLRRRHSTRAAPAVVSSSPSSPQDRHGHLEVRRRPQARALEAADHDQG